MYYSVLLRRRVRDAQHIGNYISQVLNVMKID